MNFIFSTPSDMYFQTLIKQQEKIVKKLEKKNQQIEKQIKKQEGIT